jgi:hypothetical protein
MGFETFMFPVLTIASVFSPDFGPNYTAIAGESATFTIPLQFSPLFHIQALQIRRLIWCQGWSWAFVAAQNAGGRTSKKLTKKGKRV